jgi:hypothetical protein
VLHRVLVANDIRLVAYVPDNVLRPLLADIHANPSFDAFSVTCPRLDELEFVADRAIRQAIATQAPAALILSPLLTGGKVFKPT